MSVKVHLVVNRLTGYVLYTGINQQFAQACWNKRNHDRNISWYEVNNEEKLGTA